MTYWLRTKIDLSQADVKSFKDLPEKRFNIDQPGPIDLDGPIFLKGGDDPEPPTTLRLITAFEIDGKLDVSGTEMPLKHGNFDGANYSNSTAVVDDLKFHWAITEGEDGQRTGTRVAPLDDPLNAQTYRSEGEIQMHRVPEGHSDM